MRVGLGRRPATGGLDRAAAAAVLDTFPPAGREQDRSKDLILGFMAALAASCPDAAVSG
jgi:hypothetical protein